MRRGTGTVLPRMATDLLTRYSALVAAHEIERDRAQETVARQLAALETRLTHHRLARKSSSLGWLFGDVADELPLGWVGLLRVVAGFQHPGVSMRPGYDARRTIVVREVYQSADRVASVPHARRALPSPINV